MDCLPEEVLDVIFTCLVPKDFLSLCRISKSFYERHHLNPFYWRNQASSTFRLPISSLLRADGARWYWLYKKLKTQTCLYTWGKGVHGNLGPTEGFVEGAYPAAPRQLPMPPPGRIPMIRGRPGRRPGRGQTWQRVSSSWPTKVHLPEDVNIIVDVQCGGWSTTLLTSDGELFSVGMLDAADARHVGKSFDQFTRLEYLTQSTTGIRQFSAGRRHVLALDDNGQVHSWDRIDEKGYKVFPRDGLDFGGVVDYVQSGWGHSSAYVPSKGIFYWAPLENDLNDTMLDGVHVKEFLIPNTHSRKKTINRRDDDFRVLKHIVLEGWIVFLMGCMTGGDAKLFAYRTGNENMDVVEAVNPVFEVPGYGGTARHLQDLQGSFRSFCVFTDKGEVLAGSVDYLNVCALNLDAETPIDDGGNSSTAQFQVRVSDDLLAARPRDIPVLQHNGVIGVAFGDYHCLALHANGTITAHGRDASGVGSLGLGNPPSYGKFRGLRASEGADFDLLPIAARRGRQVWFEPGKKEWLEWLNSSYDKCVNENVPDGDHAYVEFQQSPEVQAGLSEWVEQEGRHWEDGPLAEGDAASARFASSSNTQDYDSLGAYFAIAVTAAGWHSGALVMVNNAKAEAVQERWMVQSAEPTMPGHFEDEQESSNRVPFWKDRPFPIVRLPDGKTLGKATEEKTVSKWRDGTPSREDLGFRGQSEGEAATAPT